MPHHSLFAIAFLSASALSAQEVTFSQDIAPIIFNNCSKCHSPGQVGPFSLLSYSDVTTHARTIAAVTQSHYMPPWKPEPGWTTYRDERRLTATQIDLIQRWVANGMPEGDPSKTPAAPVFSDGWQLGAPDLVLEMPAAYSVPAEGTDIYRNFAIPTGLKEDKWVRAIEFRPSARSVVHHSLFFADSTHKALQQDGLDGQPGFPGFQSVFTIDPTSSLNGGLGGWVPGTVPAFLPGGISMSLPAGADFLLQTHFHLNGTAWQEKTKIALYFGPKPDRPMTQIQVPAFFGIQAHIDIAPGVKDYKVRGSFQLPAAVDAVGVWAHAHYLAKEAKLTATLPSGEVRILLWIRQWDFNWQDQYLFENLIPLPAGTRLDGELTYDNSVDNIRNPANPPKRVTWGEQSTDEMGSLLLNVVPKNSSDLQMLQSATYVYLLSPVPLVGSKPFFVSSGLVDAASGQPGAVTPGKIMVLYGAALGPASVSTGTLGPDGRLSTTAGGTEVTFDGVPAPLLYTSAGQLAAIVPYSMDGKSGTQMRVRNGGLTSDPVALPVVAVSPSIFSSDMSGSGQAAIINQDGYSPNSSAHPAEKGSVISIYATGEGQTQPGGVDGLIATSASLPRPIQPVEVLINGHPAEVLYAGAANGSAAGLFQVNARIPEGTAAGNIPVVIRVGNVESAAGLTVAVK